MEKRFKVGLPDVKVLEEGKRRTLKRIARMRDPLRAQDLFLPIAKEVQNMAELKGLSAQDLEQILPEFGDAAHAIIKAHEDALHELDRKIAINAQDRNMLLLEAQKVYGAPANTLEERLQRMKRVLGVLESLAELKEGSQALKDRKKEHIDSLTELFEAAPIAYLIHTSRRGDEKKIHPSVTEAFLRANARRKRKTA